MIIAATEQPAGWGRLIGLGVAIAVFLLFVRVRRWLVATGRLPSPEKKPPPVNRVKRQVSEGPGSDDPTDDPIPEEGVAEYEWGSVSGTNNRVEVVLRRAGEPSKAGDFDGWVRAQLGRLRPADIVREAHRHFGRSASTTKRAIRRAREGRRKP